MDGVQKASKVNHLAGSYLNEQSVLLLVQCNQIVKWHEIKEVKNPQDTFLVRLVWELGSIHSL